MSEFRRLVLCVDNSGSMSGAKIKASMDFLNDLATQFNVPTNYYKFTSTVREVKKYDKTTLNASGGTDIEKSLQELFGTELRKYSDFNEKTKFIFVTDAEDKIQKVNDIISSKTECETKYKHDNLDCECLLTSNRKPTGMWSYFSTDPTCSDDLETIFTPQFHHCHDNNFKSVLDRLCAAIKQAQQIAPKLHETETEVETITESAASDDKDLRNKNESIRKGIKESDKISKKAKAKIERTERGIKTIKSQKNYVVKQVHRIKDIKGIKKAENDMKPMKSQLLDHRRDLCDAERLLKKQEQILKDLAMENQEMKAMLSGCDHREKIRYIVSNINLIMHALDNIKRGAHHHVRLLKAAFTVQLQHLIEATQHRNEIEQQFIVSQKDIEQSFEDLTRKRGRIRTFKEEISQNIADINRILHEVDDKWDAFVEAPVEVDLKRFLCENQLDQYFQVLAHNGFRDFKSLQYLNVKILRQEMSIPMSDCVKLLQARDAYESL